MGGKAERMAAAGGEISCPAGEAKLSSCAVSSADAHHNAQCNNSIKCCFQHNILLPGIDLLDYLLSLANQR